MIGLLMPTSSGIELWITHNWRRYCVRKNAGKPKLSKCLLMPEALSGLESVLVFGEEKYDAAERKSWMAYKPDEVMDSLLRHLMAVKNGEDQDPESGLPHVHHALFNAAVLVEINSYCSSEDSYEHSLHEGSSGS
jgi:hypothetical protein